MSFNEKVGMVVVVINGESGLRLQRKCRSLTEEVGRVVVNIEIWKRLKGVFAKNERGYRLNAIKKRF